MAYSRSIVNDPGLLRSLPLADNLRHHRYHSLDDPSLNIVTTHQVEAARRLIGIHSRSMSAPRPRTPSELLSPRRSPPPPFSHSQNQTRSQPATSSVWMRHLPSSLGTLSPRNPPYVPPSSPTPLRPSSPPPRPSSSPSSPIQRVASPTSPHSPLFGSRPTPTSPLTHQTSSPKAVSRGLTPASPQRRPASPHPPTPGIADLNRIYKTIWLGSMDALKINILKPRGIEWIINTAFEVETAYTHEVDWDELRRHGIQNMQTRWDDALDQKIYPSVELEQGVELLDRLVNAGINVLVNCSMGKSRSTSLVIAYLIIKTGLSYDEALRLCKSSRSVSQPNKNFELQLRQLDVDMCAERLARVRAQSPSIESPSLRRAHSSIGAGPTSPTIRSPKHSASRPIPVIRFLKDPI